jgi:hypothetical protein
MHFLCTHCSTRFLTGPFTQLIIKCTGTSSLGARQPGRHSFSSKSLRRKSYNTMPVINVTRQRAAYPTIACSMRSPSVRYNVMDWARHDAFVWTVRICILCSFYLRFSVTARQLRRRQEPFPYTQLGGSVSSTLTRVLPR